MGLEPADTELLTLDEENIVGSTLDSEVIRCLDAVTSLLDLQRSTSNLLREGWLEIAKARYTLGPTRISYPLFSLRPCAASTLVGLSSVPADCGADQDKGADSDEGLSSADSIEFNFKLLMGGFEEQERVAFEDEVKPAVAPAKLRRRVTLQGLRGHATTEKLVDALVLSDDSESDAETDPLSSKANRHKQDPLLMFGTLIPPHLRAAQSLFTKALELVIKIAETKCVIQLSCDKVMALKHRDPLHTHEDIGTS